MLRWFAIGLLILAVTSGGSFAAEQAPPAGPAKPVASTELHNVFQIDDRLYSGSSPDNDAAFQELVELGVKVILSVDGSKPNVELAHQYGMRYVHLPIGYDGVPQKRGEEIAKAVSDAGAPVYMHCHHGKHRGPAAVATACLAVKGWSVEQAESFLKQAGTAPEYAGLFRDVRGFRPPTAAELAKLPGKFPEVAKTAPLVDTMVSIDERFDALKAAQKASWREIPTQSTPAQTATLLWEQFRELVRDPDTAKHPGDFRAQMEKAEHSAAALRAVLADPASTPAAREEAMKASTQNCAACHKAHRN
jgi:protein tyrosine phosphatase (PTP) superfamily phosphohydrolase (DUF442 family)